MKPAVLVIGGGIVGASVTFRLAAAGSSVALLESGNVGQGASRASFAWLNSSNKHLREYHDLNVRGMNEYRALAAELDDFSSLNWSGNTEWDGQAGGPDLLRNKVERLQSWGYPAEFLPISELRRIEPELVAPGAIKEFAWYRQEGYVHPQQVIDQLIAAARRSGASIRENSRVEALVLDGPRVVGVEIRGGDRLSSDVVVTCAGSQTQNLLRTAGLDLPLAPVSGMVAVSGPGTKLLNSVHHDDLMHIRPAGNGRIMMRHTDFDKQVQLDEPVTRNVLNQLRTRVATVLPSIAGVEFETARVAVRPIPADGLTVAGFAGGLDSLYVIVSHSAVTLGPLLGRLATEEILEGRRDSRLSLFGPDRLIRTANSSAAVR